MEIKFNSRVKVITNGEFKGRIGRVKKIQKTGDKRGMLLSVNIQGGTTLKIYEKEIKLLHTFKKRDTVIVTNEKSPAYDWAGVIKGKYKLHNGFGYNVEFDEDNVRPHDEDELELLNA